METKLLLSLLILQTSAAIDQNYNETSLGQGKFQLRGVDKIYKKMNFLRTGEHLCSGPDGTHFTASLVNTIVRENFNSCTPVILYDEFYSASLIFQEILTQIMSMVGKPLRHGQISSITGISKVRGNLARATESLCLNFVIFVKEIEAGGDSILNYVESYTKVVIVSQSSNWHVDNFLSSMTSHFLPNLVLISDPTLRIQYLKKDNTSNIKECDIKMYTHRLFADSLGSSHSMILTTWRNGKFARNVNLFPDKFKDGFNGLQFVVAAAEQPPFVFRKKDQEVAEGYRVTSWEGLEIRLLSLICEMLNITIDIREPTESNDDASERVLKEVLDKRADVAIGGIYATPERDVTYLLSMPHSQDCAAFISLASTALPKYRAIMGPFLWDVWLVLTFTYIFAMFPIAFSVWHSIRPLLNDVVELQNMFWYVFGTFTNCFTFTGTNSWSRSKMVATRIFIGSYWVFTIIVTAAYTGSIIAFITLPVFPEVIDTSKQILEEHFKVTTLDSGGWRKIMSISDDPIAEALYKDMDFAPTVNDGLLNVTRNSRSNRHSTFFGSKDLLEYIVRANFTPSTKSKRSLFHLSNECFVPLMVCIAFDKKALFGDEINSAMIRLTQAGFITKITKEVQWHVYRSSSGKLLQQSSLTPLHNAVPEDRQLTLDDVQGMFLLLGAGFAIAFLAFFLELTHWIYKEIKFHTPGEPTLYNKVHCQYRKSCHRLSTMIFSPSESYCRTYTDKLDTATNNFSKGDNLWSYFGSLIESSQDIFDSNTSSKVDLKDLVKEKPSTTKSMVHLKEPPKFQQGRFRSF